MGWKKRQKKRRNQWKKDNPHKRGEKNMMDSLQRIQNQNLQAKAGQTSVNRVMSRHFGLQNLAPKEECWESGIEVLKSCGSAPASVNVTIGNIAMAKINALMAHYVRMEWLAYLIGSDNHITDIIIPEQEVTPVKVEVDPEGVSVPTMGVIHSHHDMGNSFSHTDDTYINQNHDMSLCISKDGINGVVRIKTACDKYIMVKASVSLKTEGFDVDAFIKEADALITEKTFITRIPNHMGVHQQFHPHSTGAEMTGLGMGEGINQNILGIVDLADAFTKDLTDSPDLFDLMDMVGYKEILQEVIKPARNMDIFTSLYNNLLDNNSFIEDELHYNVQIELLDEIESAFATMTNQEHLALISLLKKLDGVIGEIEEEMLAEHFISNDITVIGSSSDELTDGTEDIDNPDVWCQNDTWEGEQPDVVKEDTKSDNIWNTNG